MLTELARLARADFDVIGKEGAVIKVKGCSIVTVDENGRFPR